MAPPAQIDFIFAPSRLLPDTVTGVGAEPVLLSDHRPVWAVLRWNSCCPNLQPAAKSLKRWTPGDDLAARRFRDLTTSVTASRGQLVDLQTAVEEAAEVCVEPLRDQSRDPARLKQASELSLAKRELRCLLRRFRCTRSSLSLREVRAHRATEQRTRRQIAAHCVRTNFLQQKKIRTLVSTVTLPDGTRSSDRLVWAWHLRCVAERKYLDITMRDPMNRAQLLDDLRQEACLDDLPDEESLPTLGDLLAARGQMKPGKAAGGTSKTVPEIIKALPLTVVWTILRHFTRIALGLSSLPMH